MNREIFYVLVNNYSYLNMALLQARDAKIAWMVEKTCRHSRTRSRETRQTKCDSIFCELICWNGGGAADGFRGKICNMLIPTSRDHRNRTVMRNKGNIEKSDRSSVREKIIFGLLN